jgi:hypothetical protein
MRIFILSAGVLLVAAGCDPAMVDISFDQDQDGLLSNEEEDIGTDPNDADSDGDGHLDGDEVFAGTDPLDADDHPYLGGWDITRCDEVPQPTGDDLGQITADFQLFDQYGEEVSLYDFCQKTVLLVTGTFW